MKSRRGVKSGGPPCSPPLGKAAARRGAAAAIRSFFDAPTRGPLWSREGVFLYPPRSLWKPVRPAQVAAAWKAAVKNPAALDPAGLYVHIPAELAALGDYFSSRREHPYIESLKNEAELLAPGAELSFKTLYLGSGGAGALSLLSPADLHQLLRWLRRRFRLKSLSQGVAEVDATRLIPEQARMLARHGIDRVSARLPPSEGPQGLQERRDFADGIRRCRQAGVRTIAIDLTAGHSRSSAGAAYLDAEFVRSLKPDAIHLNEQSTGGASKTRLAALRKLLARPGTAAGRESAANNLQLFHATEYNASILGLGWGAVSHIRGRLVCAPADSCFKHVDALLHHRVPPYAGGVLSDKLEMRAHIIRSLEDNGRLERSTFRAAFSMNPEAAFPAEFSALLREGRLRRRADRFHVPRADGKNRYLASVRFYGTAVLRRLAAAPCRPADREPALPANAPVPTAHISPANPAAAPEHLIEEGVRFFEQGALAKAINRFDRALRIDPEHTGALINRGAAAAAGGKLDEALKFYNDAVRSGPLKAAVLADALSARAGALAGLGRRQDAVRDIERALRIAPKTWSRRARVARELNKLRCAR